MRILVAIPLLLLMVLFALSNPQLVRLGLWPTDFMLEAPLSLVILVAMAAAFLLGALMLWAAGLGAGRRARKAEYAARVMDAQLQEMKARLDARPGASLPGRPAGPALPPPA
jgi:uncharacterized integral membrane protein